MSQDPLPSLHSGTAVFDHERRYRYRLERRWSYGTRWLCVVGLNPSTADERLDDPTSRRCAAYARQWGYDGMLLVNLFAARATDPRQLRGITDPVGPDNDRHLREAAAGAGYGHVLAAWGNGGVYLDRGRQVSQQLLAQYAPLCLAVTQLGQPVHPLYQRADAVPVPYVPDDMVRWAQLAAQTPGK